MHLIEMQRIVAKPKSLALMQSVYPWWWMAGGLVYIVMYYLPKEIFLSGFKYFAQ
jgi:hypothetical protein